jgi:hypothetical protein
MYVYRFAPLSFAIILGGMIKKGDWVYAGMICKAAKQNVVEHENMLQRRNIAVLLWESTRRRLITTGHVLVTPNQYLAGP